MLTAKMGGEIIRADKNLKHLDFVYRCRDPHCKAPEMMLIAGERGLRIPHFRHRVDAGCKCGKGETEWHLAWKSHFDNVEVDMGFDSATGEYNRADALTKDKVVIEFQHSPISLVEQTAREKYYSTTGGMIWVVDANHVRALKRLDIHKEFFTSEDGMLRGLLSVEHPERVFPDCWHDRPTGVVFDYGPDRDLVWLLPGRYNGRAYFQMFKREPLVEMLIKSSKAFLNTINMFVAANQSAISNRVQQAVRPVQFPTRVQNLGTLTPIGNHVYIDQNGRQWSDRFGAMLPMTKKFAQAIKRADRREAFKKPSFKKYSWGRRGRWL